MLLLNFANMMEEVIGPNGMNERAIEGLRPKTSEMHREIIGKKRPELEFMDLPDQDTADIRKLGGEVRQESENFLLLGIGGSALGPRAILEALSPYHNLRKKPRVFIYNNVDPRTLRHILSVVDLTKTTVNVVSKSGSTAESTASFMILWDKMKKALGEDAVTRFIATTGPESGNLRKIASDHGMRTLPIGRGIGGRYSVLSPVGLLLAEAIGVDSREMLKGAADMIRRCATDEILKNPAYMFGGLLHLMNVDRKRNVDVLIPYADGLKFLSEWFCQLWSESLGKEGKGMTPYPSVGTTDQHSQMQLWIEGPEDKVVTFIRIDEYGSDYAIPRVFEDVEGTSYLSGRHLSELINAEEESSELALAKKGRPNMTIRIPSIDAYHLGQLFQFFEIATAFTGLLMGIDPFNQPGVEEAKNVTYGMMGNEVFDAKREEVEKAREYKTSWQI